MTNEEKCVVNPLEKYLFDFKRSGAKWKLKNKPAYGISATGWDLQVERKNEVLLIEAKYIRGPFTSAFAGLVISPLSYRPEKMKYKNLYRSKYSTICWAIGVGYNKVDEYKMRDIYQILFDYISRNVNFWKYYSKILKVKYIFFVNNNGKVAKISFTKMIQIAENYKKLAEQKQLNERRNIAQKLIEKSLKFS